MPARIALNTGEVMKTKNVVRERNVEHGPLQVTPAGHSVFYDQFPKAEADELVMPSTLLRGLEQWLNSEGAGSHRIGCWRSSAATLHLPVANVWYLAPINLPAAIPA